MAQHCGALLVGLVSAGWMSGSGCGSTQSSGSEGRLLEGVRVQTDRAAKKKRMCAARRKAIEAERRHAAACERRSDCRIMPSPVCSTGSKECGYWALNPARSEGLYLAIDAYQSASCKRRKCDCRARPDFAICHKGRCSYFQTSMGVGKAAGLEGTFVTPTLNAHWLLRLEAGGTFSWTVWTTMSEKGKEERTRGTWRVTGPARITLKITESKVYIRPPATLWVFRVGGQTVLLDDHYIRERRRTPPGRDGQILIARKKGETGAPALVLFGRNDVKDFHRLLRAVKLPQ